MRIVIALGGNALLRREQALSAENQLQNTRLACRQIARVIAGNEVVIAHGNGPQVGLLALQGAAYKDVDDYPLDILVAETEGMIGYLIQQELGNLVPMEVPLATILTQVEVSMDDPAFQNPTKPIGPFYSKAEAEEIAKSKGWNIAPDGDKYRRVVASPRPQRIFELRPITWLLEKGSVVICAGGGGVPAYYDEEGKLHGVEAVIDKDLCSSFLAECLDADKLIIATDVDGIYLNYGKPGMKRVISAHPRDLAKQDFARGSMGPKVEAACNFVQKTGHSAVIGSLEHIEEMLHGTSGTAITNSASSMITT